MSSRFDLNMRHLKGQDWTMDCKNKISVLGQSVKHCCQFTKLHASIQQVILKTGCTVYLQQFLHLKKISAFSAKCPFGKRV